MSAQYQDAALFEERTQLAWQRFALAIAVVAVISLRAALVEHHAAAGFALAFVLGTLALALQLKGPRMPARVAVQLAQAATWVAVGGALLLVLL